jgi:tyrosine-protein phosphatase SIW14
VFTVTRVRWLLALLVVAALVVTPILLHRHLYNQNRRLRVVTDGKVYRSGQMTAQGFTEAVRRHGIRTVMNLQDEYPDPDVRLSVWGSGTIKETELCRQLGVRYVHLPPKLIPRRELPQRRPETIDEFLTLMDDPDIYPVLLHCKAGLHRTGVLVAAYRMEYEGRTPREALRELRDNGFGLWASTAANDYIAQYLFSYRPGLRPVRKHPAGE